MNAEKIAFFLSFFSLFLNGQERRQKRIPYIMYRDVGTGRAGRGGAQCLTLPDK